MNDLKICCFHVLKTNIPQNSRSFEQIPFEISLLIANSDARFKKSWKKSTMQVFFF